MCLLIDTSAYLMHLAWLVPGLFTIVVLPCVPKRGQDKHQLALCGKERARPDQLALCMQEYALLAAQCIQ